MISKRLEVKAGRKDIRAPHLGQIVFAVAVAVAVVAGGKDARQRMRRRDQIENKRRQRSLTIFRGWRRSFQGNVQVVSAPRWSASLPNCC